MRGWSRRVLNALQQYSPFTLALPIVIGIMDGFTLEDFFSFLASSLSVQPTSRAVGFGQSTEGVGTRAAELDDERGGCHRAPVRCPQQDQVGGRVGAMPGNDVVRKVQSDLALHTDQCKAQRCCLLRFQQ